MQTMQQQTAFLQKFEQTCEKCLTNFCKDFEFGAVRRCVTWDSKGAKVCKSCRSRKMLKNAYLVAKIGFDTEENERSKVR